MSKTPKKTFEKKPHKPFFFFFEGLPNSKGFGMNGNTELGMMMGGGLLYFLNHFL